jgi:surface protein
MFMKCELFNQSLNTWDVSSVTNMKNMFRGAKLFNQPLNNWNVSLVESMEGMFHSADTFNEAMFTLQPGNSVTTLKGMFYHADQFDQNLNHWTVATSVDTSLIFTNTAGGSATWA